MKAITFEQFIRTFNFRDFNEYASTETDKHDTKIVRFYLDDDSLDKWFELGVYDFGKNTWEIILRSLSQEVYNSYIGSISYDTNLEVLKVYLQESETIQ